MHPTKTEIRFLDTSQVFKTIVHTVNQVIGLHGAPAFAPGLAFTASEGATTAWHLTPTAASAPSYSDSTPANPEWKLRAGPGFFDSRPRLTDERSHAESTQDQPVPTPYAAHPFSKHQYVGVIFQTYLLYDLGQELALIDQHAAHERIRYEKLKLRALSREHSGSQALLLPESAPFDAERITEVLARLPWLEQLGFEAEIFGESALLFRAVPTEWGTENLRVRLKALLERLLESETPPVGATFDERLFEKLASEACHSAIRAGDRLEPIHALALVDQLFETEHPWNCPHGRPTVVRIPRGRFEEWFQRRV